MSSFFIKYLLTMLENYWFYSLTVCLISYSSLADILPDMGSDPGDSMNTSGLVLLDSW